MTTIHAIWAVDVIYNTDYINDHTGPSLHIGTEKKSVPVSVFNVLHLGYK